MKKLISVLFVLVILSFAIFGCSSKDSKNKNNENKQEETLKSVAGNDFFNLEDIPVPYETITDAKSYSVPAADQTYNMDTDCQNYYGKTLYSYFDIAETDSTIFFYNNYINEAHIRMLDKESKIVKPFCNKPECSHTTEECNSSFKDVLGMFYYNKHLYIIRQEYFENEDIWDKIEINLYKVSIETQEREKVKNIATALTDGKGMDSCFVAYIQHRGYLYYIYDIGTGGEKDIFYNNGSNSLYRISLENDSEKECIANMERTGGLICPFLRLQASGSYVYYMIPDEQGMGEVYRFNTETLKNEALNLGVIAMENFVVWDGDIYYKKDWKETKIYKVSSDLTKEELYIDTQVSGYEKSSDFRICQDYMYVTSFDDESYKLYTVYNKAGECVAEIDFPVSDIINIGGRDIFVSYDWNSVSPEQYPGGYGESKKGVLYILDLNNIKKNKEDNVFTRIDL